jgi:hypothetical protein
MGAGPGALPRTRRCSRRRSGTVSCWSESPTTRTSGRRSGTCWQATPGVGPCWTRGWRPWPNVFSPCARRTPRGGAVRPLPDHLLSRRRWDGDGVPRRPRRPGERGGPQAAPGCGLLAGAKGPVPRGAADPGAAATPRNRAPAGCRAPWPTGRPGSSWSWWRERRWMSTYRTMAPTVRAAPRPLPGDRGGGAPCPRPCGHPPGPEAFQHPRASGRHGETHRLRDRQAPVGRGGVGARRPSHPDRTDAADAGPCRPRTAPGRSGGRAHRCLRPGPAALPDPDGGDPFDLEGRSSAEAARILSEFDPPRPSVAVHRGMAVPGSSDGMRCHR